MAYIDLKWLANQYTSLRGTSGAITLLGVVVVLEVPTSIFGAVAREDERLFKRGCKTFALH